MVGLGLESPMIGLARELEGATMEVSNARQRSWKSFIELESRVIRGGWAAQGTATAAAGHRA